MWEAIERLQQDKEIAKPITPPSETASEEDIDPEQAQRDKDMQKNLALITKYFKKIYKPINNNLRTSLNSRNKNYDWLEDTDEEVDEQELEAHYSYMAKIQEPKWSRFVTIVKQQHKLDEVSYHKLFDILKQYQNEVNELRVERLAKNANPLALVATGQASKDPYYQTSKSHKSHAPSSKPSIPTRSHTTTKYKDKEIAKPITPPSEIASEEDIDPEQAQRDKDMQKSLALITKYFKKIYKPINNNLRTSLNSRNKNVDTTPRYKNDNQYGQFRNQRTVNVVGAREKIGSPYDWLEDTDEEVDEQELEAHYSYMAKIQENDQNDVESDDEQIFDNAWIKHSKNQFRAPTAQDIEILIQTCLMPLATKTQNDSFRFVHELKLEMHANLKYVESLKKEIDELESDKAEFSDMYDVILQECVSKDVMCSYLMSLSDLDALDELQCLYLHKVKECDLLAQKFLNQTKSVSKEVHYELLKRFAKVEKHSISLEIALQKRKEQVKNDTVSNEKASNVFRKEREQYFKIQDLRAQLQDKNIAISELKKLIEKGKGKSVDTKFDKPFVVRQPNAQRIPKLSVLGKAVSNTNVLKPGMYRIDNRLTHIRAPQLPQTVRSTGVNHKPNVSRPQHKSNQSRDKVLPNNSQVKVKKTQVEVHPRISSVSNKMKSVTACKDKLNSRTLNANVVCATCNKCLVDSNHFACVTKMLNDVNARTKKPTVVPINTRKPKSQANKSILACSDDDDDYNFAITPNEPVDSLSMGDKHLDTVPATESDEFIKSCVENLVPNPSESEGENGCDVPACFTTFSNVLFNADYEFDSSDDQSLYYEDVPEKIFSNPLFEEDIIPIKIDQHHNNAESTHDSSLIISSKIDSLLYEFVGELTLLKSILPEIDETDCDHKEYIRIIERLL
nr:hypothetical protein [Tanacetum cinerariifolium]